MQELFLGEQSLQDEPPELGQQAQVWQEEETQHCTQPVELHQAGAQMGVNTFQKRYDDDDSDLQKVLMPDVLHEASQLLDSGLAEQIMADAEDEDMGDRWQK